MGHLISFTYFFVVVRLPFTMRVEVETALKLPVPPPMLSIPPMDEEKEVKSTEKHIIGQERKIKSINSEGSLRTLSLFWLLIRENKHNKTIILWIMLIICGFLPPAEGKEKKRLGPTWDEPQKGVKSSEGQKFYFEMMQNSIKADFTGRMIAGLAECEMLWIEKTLYNFSSMLITKEGTKGILAPKKVPEHLIWAAECEGEFWEIWRKFWAGGACGEREWQEKN